MDESLIECLNPRELHKEKVSQSHNEEVRELLTRLTSAIADSPAAANSPGLIGSANKIL